MNIHWQITAGGMFELLRPAAFAISAFLSTCVLYSARNSGFDSYTAFGWALGTLFFPFIVLPVYFIARFRKRSKRKTFDKVEAPGPMEGSGTSPQSREGLMRRIWLPVIYAGIVYSIGALLFYRDHRSFDAHLARANQARLVYRRENTISEYRAALQLKNDSHTHSLLAAELTADGRLEDALREYKLAESGADPDHDLPFNIAGVLEQLHRTDEALKKYKEFLRGTGCEEPFLSSECEAARAKLSSVAGH